MRKQAPGTHILSVDVEDYFQVSAFHEVIRADSWEHWPSRIVPNTLRVLGLLDEYQIKATFFVLGWIAERFPSLIREISQNGHEIGCHSYRHRRIHQFQPEEFRQDTRLARQAIESAAGSPVLGYRAPDWSINKQCFWALDILAEEGFIYDSSISPVGRSATRIPYTHRCRNGLSIREFPAATLGFAGLRARGAGGAYLRVLPMSYTRLVLARMERVNAPAVVYFHPWELDTEQPRVKAGLTSRARHYTNLGGMQDRLRFLFDHFTFHAFRDMLMPSPAERWARARN